MKRRLSNKRSQENITRLKRLTKEELAFRVIDAEQESKALRQAFEEFEGAVTRATRVAVRYRDRLEVAEVEVKRLESVVERMSGPPVE